MKVTIRARKFKSKKQADRLSLYLDYYPGVTMPDGSTSRRESLGLWVYDDGRLDTDAAAARRKRRALSPLQVDHNRETDELADHVRARRQVEAQNARHDFRQRGSEQKLGDYFDDLWKRYADAKGESKEKLPSIAYTWRTLASIVREIGLDVPLCNLDEYRANGVYRHLMAQISNRTLKQSSAHKYSVNFKASITRAFESKLIKDRVHEGLKIVPRGQQEQRESLTADELGRLVRTPLEPIRNKANAYDLSRLIAVISVQMGFATMEIRRLEWDWITDLPDGRARVRYWRQKTKKWITCYMPASVRQAIGDRGTGPVFPYVPDQATLNRVLSMWCHNAGIEKHITMHCMRHTFATLQLAEDTKLHVLSAMLGHSDIKTTQIYTRTLDEDLSAAAGRVSIGEDAPLLRLVK
jgi:integrase